MQTQPGRDEPSSGLGSETAPLQRVVAGVCRELDGDMQTIKVGVGPVSFEDLIHVARGGAPVELTDEALGAIDHARGVIETLAAAETPTYGVSTGFGALATRHIPTEMRAQLQRSLVRSHAAGSGPEVEREVVRALMLLRLSTLATGRTGVRRETAQLMADLLSHGITPVVREYGSLGCSGDLAPLSHCALALMGEGEVRDAAGTLMPAADALAAAGLAPVELVAKEGLALINGTDGMLGMLVMAITDLRMLLRTADIAAAMSVEGQLGTDRVFAPELQAIRPHPGQALSAANLTALMADSAVVASHRTGPENEVECNRVQDAYSLRCSPAGARRRPRHRRARRHRRRARAGQRDRQPGRPRRHTSSPTATSTAPRWATSSTSSRSSPPTWPRSASGVRTGSSTRRAATACRRSSPTTPASTAAT